MTVAAALEMAEQDFSRRAAASTETNTSKGLINQQMVLLRARLTVLAEANTITSTKPPVTTSSAAKPAAKKVTSVKAKAAPASREEKPSAAVAAVAAIKANP